MESICFRCGGGCCSPNSSRLWYVDGTERGRWSCCGSDRWRYIKSDRCRWSSSGDLCRKTAYISKGRWQYILDCEWTWDGRLSLRCGAWGDACILCTGSIESPGSLCPDLCGVTGVGNRLWNVSCGCGRYHWLSGIPSGKCKCGGNGGRVCYRRTNSYLAGDDRLDLLFFYVLWLYYRSGSMAARGTSLSGGSQSCTEWRNGIICRYIFAGWPGDSIRQWKPLFSMAGCVANSRKWAETAARIAERSQP